MKKETIRVLVPVTITYETPAGRKAAIAQARREPGSVVASVGYQGPWTVKPRRARVVA